MYHLNLPSHVYVELNILFTFVLTVSTDQNGRTPRKLTTKLDISWQDDVSIFILGAWLYNNYRLFNVSRVCFISMLFPKNHIIKNVNNAQLLLLFSLE